MSPGASKALNLTMALHELATNAVKYGALSNAGGQVRLDWAMQSFPPQIHLELKWALWPVTPPRRKGFGSNLIQRTSIMWCWISPPAASFVVWSLLSKEPLHGKSLNSPGLALRRRSVNRIQQPSPVTCL